MVYIIFYFSAVVMYGIRKMCDIDQPDEHLDIVLAILAAAQAIILSIKGL